MAVASPNSASARTSWNLLVPLAPITATRGERGLVSHSVEAFVGQNSQYSLVQWAERHAWQWRSVVLWSASNIARHVTRPRERLSQPAPTMAGASYTAYGSTRCWTR